MKNDTPSELAHTKPRARVRARKPAPKPFNMLNPVEVYNAAVARIPQLKFALGVAGMVAAGMIALATAKFDARIAIMSFGFVFAGMLLLYLFVRIPKTMGNGPIKLLTWAVASLFILGMVATFSSAAWCQPQGWSNLLGLEHACKIPVVISQDPDAARWQFQREYVRTIELDLAEKIQSALEPILGEGQVRTTVTAQVNFSKSTQTESLYKPTSPKEEQPRQGEVDKVVRTVEQVSGRITRISANVILNYRRSLDAKTKTGIAPLTADQMAQINTIAKEAVGWDESRGDTLSVTNTPFDHPEFRLNLSHLIAIGLSIGITLVSCFAAASYRRRIKQQ